MALKNQLIAVAALLLAATPALAQTAERWDDPTGTWSLDFVASGWGHAEGLPNGGPVLLTVPVQAPPDNETRICWVEQSISDVASGTTAAEVQRHGAEVGPREAETAMQRLHMTQTQVGHAVVDGVEIATVEGVSGRNRVRGRIFQTFDGARAVLSTLSCISERGMPPAREAEVDAILGTLRFAGPWAGLDLSAPEMQSGASAQPPDAQLAEMLDLYREFCFTAFPDDAAVARAVNARQGRPLSASQVRQYLRDDPGVGWTVRGATAEFVITIEQPPFHACAIRSMTVAGFPNAQPFVDFVAAIEAGRSSALMGRMNMIVGNARTRGEGRIYSGADRPPEGLMAIVTTPASGRGDGGRPSTEVRFARQFAEAASK